MENSSLRLIFLSAVATLFATPCALAQSIQCTDASGKIIYQQGPCEGRSSQRGSPFDASSSKPASKSVTIPVVGREQTREEESGMAIFLLMKAGCDLYIPGFAASVSDGFEIFRRQHWNLIVKAEAAAQLPLHIEEMKKNFQSAASAPINQAQAESCEAMANGFAEYRAPPDPLLASPELVLKGWLVAMRGGDREGAVRFLTGRALKSYGPWLPDMPDDEMRKQADSYDGIQIIQKNSNFAELPDGRRYSGFRTSFVKVGENWKIEYL